MGQAGSSSAVYVWRAGEEGLVARGVERGKRVEGVVWRDDGGFFFFFFAVAMGLSAGLERGLC